MVMYAKADVNEAVGFGPCCAFCGRSGSGVPGPERFHSTSRDKNRRDIGKSQPEQTAHKMETPPRTPWLCRRGAPVAVRRVQLPDPTGAGRPVRHDIELKEEVGVVAPGEAEVTLLPVPAPFHTVSASASQNIGKSQSTQISDHDTDVSGGGT
jgi:hypothetical protein